MAAEQPGRRPVAFMIALGCLQIIWPLTMDVYLPAFPQIQHSLHTSASLVQSTLTGAFVGMAFGQLITGPVSDRLGRMRPLLAVLIVFCVAAGAGALAPDVRILIIARFFQGFGAAGAAVIGLAIVRDVTSGPRMVRLLANLQLISGVFVVGSPALGAQLLRTFDWRGVFWMLLGYGMVLVAVTVGILWRTETRVAVRQRTEADLLRNYRILARDRRYVCVVVGGALLWAAMMSYMASSSFLFQGVFHLTTGQYAALFGGHGALMIAGAQLSARLASTSGVDRVLRQGSLVVTVAALMLLLSVTLAPGWGLAGFLVPLFLFTTGFGMVSPAIQSTALIDHGARAGTAASLLGAANMVAAAVAAPLVGLVGLGTPVPTGWFMSGCASISLALLVFGVRPSSHFSTTVPDMREFSLDQGESK